MNNKKVLFILIIIIGLFLIIFGVGVNYITTNNDINDDLNTDDDIIDTLDEEEAYNLAVSLYGGDDNSIEFTEEEDYYKIIVKDSDDNILSTIRMDKEDGTCSEEPKTD